MFLHVRLCYKLFTLFCSLLLFLNYTEHKYNLKYMRYDLKIGFFSIHSSIESDSPYSPFRCSYTDMLCVFKNSTISSTIFNHVVCSRFYEKRLAVVKLAEYELSHCLPVVKESNNTMPKPRTALCNDR